jgi:hypothetical protein
MSAVEHRKGLCLSELLQPNMMEDTVKRTPLIAIALLIATNVAFAQGKHPADIRAIDAAMQTTKLTPAQRAEVIRYRNEGERMHNSGNHGAAEVALRKAKSISKSELSAAQDAFHGASNELTVWLCGSFLPSQRGG